MVSLKMDSSLVEGSILDIIVVGVLTHTSEATTRISPTKVYESKSAFTMNILSKYDLYTDITFVTNAHFTLIK